MVSNIEYGHILPLGIVFYVRNMIFLSSNTQNNATQVLLWFLECKCVGKLSRLASVV